MRVFMRQIGLLSALGLVATLGACGDDDKATDTQQDTEVTDTSDTSDTTDTADTADTTPDTTDTENDTVEDTTPDTTPDTEPDTDTVEPTEFATLTFSVDDSANQTFDESDELQWKGSFKWDEATNVVTFDGSWPGPYPLLYDDGPAPGGHEKPGATAGDGIWTTVVKVASPDADQTFEYGAAYGAGGANWIWNGAGNGTVTVPAGSTAQIDATGMTIAPHGTIDLVLTIDVSNDGAALDPLFQGIAYSDIKVKGSAWGWSEIALVDDGTKGDATADDGVFTFKYSENLGKHDGLLSSGQVAQFVFVLDGSEYKADGAPPTAGVDATFIVGGEAIPAVVSNLPDGDKNTFVAAPELADEVEVSFQIDDSVNKTYEAADMLQWKGSFAYDAETNMITFDGAWGGPYVPLYDDGPGPDGHEPGWAHAGDNIWSAAVWVSNTATQTFEYGAQRIGDQWIWVGSNGTFTVNAGAIAPIVAPGLTIAPFGTVDFRLEIDVSGDGANLNPLFQGLDYTGKVKVKGSAWGWQEIAMVDDGTKGDTTADDGIYTFVLSQNKGKHDGLLKLGDAPQWVFVLDGVEYKADGGAAKEGVTAYSDYGNEGAEACVAVSEMCLAEVIVNVGGDNNTSVTIGAD